MGTAPGIAVRDTARSTAADPVRVLVVDDSPTVRAVFARLIEAEADLEVAASEESAERALATLLQTSPDVILLSNSSQGSQWSVSWRRAPGERRPKACGTSTASLVNWP